MRPIVYTLHIIIAMTLGSWQLNAACSNFHLPHPFKLNKFDKKGFRHGKWKSGTGTGRFRHGKEKGLWKYYALDSLNNNYLYKKEKYKVFKKIILTSHYFPNGKISSEGQAKIIDDEIEIHYYWFGHWKYYSENGILIKTVFYEQGKIIKTIFPKENN